MRLSSGEAFKGSGFASLPSGTVLGGRLRDHHYRLRYRRDADAAFLNEEAIKAYEKAVATVFNLTELTAKQSEYRDEMEVISQMMQQCIRENATVALDQTEYQERFNALSIRFESAKEKYTAVAAQISDKQSRKAQMDDFLKFLKAQDGKLTEFSDSLWLGLLDYAIIYADGRMTFTFKNGAAIDG